MSPRHLILGLALVAAAILAFLPAEEPEDEIVAPVRRTQAPAAPEHARLAVQSAGQVASQVSPSLATRPAFMAEAGSDLFPPQSFRPPPPPSPPTPKFVPPPPMAPPLPYGFIGVWTEKGEETVFLSQGDRTLSVRKGMNTGGGWRLDDIQPGSLLFTYEPLNQQSTLRIAP